MKYLQSYQLFENVKDDNLLMEITNVISQRLIESFMIEFHEFKPNDIKELTSEDAKDLLLFTNSIIFLDGRTTTQDPPSIYGESVKTTKERQAIIRKFLHKNYKPKHDKMSKKAFKIFKDMLKYSANKHEVYRTFSFEFEFGKNFAAAYYTDKPKISLAPPLREVQKFIDNMVENPLKTVNSGIFISKRNMSSLLHEIRHWYDDMLSDSKTFTVGDERKDTRTGDKWGEYFSQPHETSAIVTQFIQQIKMGGNKHANYLGITFEEPNWKHFRIAVNLHFRDFDDFTKEAKRKILTRISAEWIAHQKVTTQIIVNKVKKIHTKIQFATETLMSTARIENRVIYYATDGLYKSDKKDVVKDGLKRLIEIANMHELPILILAYEEEIKSVKNNFKEFYKPLGFKTISKKNKLSKVWNLGGSENYPIYIYQPFDKTSALAAKVRQLKNKKK